MDRSRPAAAAGFLLLSLLASSRSAEAQGPSGLWTRLAAPTVDLEAVAAPSEPVIFEWSLDRSRLDGLVRRLPPARVEAPGARARERFPVPLGDTVEVFLVEDTPVLAPALARRHPGLRTLAGVAESAPERRVRITVTPDGFHARIFLPDGVHVVRPSEPEGDRYLAGPERQLQRPSGEVCTAVRELQPRTEALLRARAAEDGERSLLIRDLRTYRLAVATTSGFAVSNGGTVESVLAVIATAVNGLNEVFQRDLGVQLQIVPETEGVIFTDPRDDPFTAETGFELLDQSQTVLDCMVGSENYDVGHTFNAAGHNLADQGVVGRRGLKGRGATGVARAGSEGSADDVFDLEYLGHELGHQFGAGHTYTGVLGACEEEHFQDTSSVEPGSGSTLMSYAGLCHGEYQGPGEGDDVQPSSDAYFHARSIEEVVEYRGAFAHCQPPAGPVGDPPRVEAGPPAAIPCGTAFLLAPETVPDPVGGALTFTWEQIDNASRQTPIFSGCCAALYRSVPPSPLSAQENPGLACDHARSDRRLTFAFTARGHGSPGSGLAIDRRVVTVRAGVGPFEVTWPAEGSRHAGPLEVRWEEAGTRDVLGVEEVEIALLCSGAPLSGVPPQTAPNGGRSTVDVPTGTRCRRAWVEVRAVGGIFLARSGSFEIESARQPASAGAPP